MNSFHHHQDPSDTASHEDNTQAIKRALQRKIGMNTEKPKGVNMLLQVLSKVDHSKSKGD